jgi:hypothetical protein
VLDRWATSAPRRDAASVQRQLENRTAGVLSRGGADSSPPLECPRGGTAAGTCRDRVARTPMRRTARRGFQRANDDLLQLIVRRARLASGRRAALP